MREEARGQSLRCLQKNLNEEKSSGVLLVSRKHPAPFDEAEGNYFSFPFLMDSFF